MFKKYLLAVVVVFIIISILDWLTHGIILMNLYSESQQIWRPMEEMKFVLGYFVSFLSVLFFVYIYYRLIDRKTPKTGLMYGLLFGITWGLSFG